MPTQIPQEEIDSFVLKTKAAPYPGGLGEADNITSRNLLVYYEDVVTCLYRQLENIQSNNNYLLQLVTSFNDDQLQAVGIWVNKTITDSPPLTDPIIIINSSVELVILTNTNPSPPVEKALSIFGNSQIGTIYLADGLTVNELRIGPGSVADSLNASNGIASPPSSPPLGANVQVIWLPAARNKYASLKSVTFGSIIGTVVIDEGSFYGGIQENPDVPCADIVTNMQATEVTKNDILVSWAPPDQYLFINTFYRKTNSKPWILATEVDGEFTDDSGFIFRNLESDTYYDFKASVICSSGGIANNMITTKTVCCGAGTQLSLYKFCQIVIKITASPDSPPATQVLCNGVTIDLQYPEGPTITIPYLAQSNSAIVSDFVLDNVPYQLMPYNPATGTWDASTTPIGSFYDGSVITVGVSIPA